MELTYSQIEISKVAEQILANTTSKILLFYGTMGVGKTTLIKEIVKQLGVDEISSSPSFSIVNEYHTAGKPIFHFDFYRIENITEAFDMGLEDYLYSGNLILIEWPDKIAKLLPEKRDAIYITKNINGSRTLKLVPVK